MKYDGFANRLEIGTAQVSQAFVINRTDGNVGIGTAIPTRKLHLKFTDDDTDLADANGIRIENESLTSGAMAVAHFRVDSNDWYLGNRKVGSTSDFFITHEASELLTIDNLGNVGIGTTSPSDQDLSINTPKLHVVGPSTTDAFNLVARFQGGNDSDNTGAAILINHSNDRGLLINAGRADSDREVAYFNLVSSGANITNMLTLKKVGEAYNVGIKTTSPAKELDVVGTVRAVDTSGNDQHQLRPTQLISYATDAIINAQSAGDDVRLNTQSNTVLIATAEGDVGIGTTSPASTLEIEAPSSANGTELKITSAFGESPKILSFDYVAANTNTSVAQIIGFGRPSTSGGPYMQFKVHTGSTLSEAMRITSSGDVGIGTTSPEKNLSIGNAQAEGIQFNYDTTNNYRNQILNYWNSTADSRMDFNIARTSGQTPVTIMSVGYNSNVGIGTTSPSAKLQVFGTSAAPSVSGTFQGSIFSIKGSSTVFLDMGTTGASGYYAWMQAHDAGTGVNYKLAINPLGGNVGIGTTSPFTNLEVAGSGLDSIIRLYAGGGTANIRTWEMRAVGVAGEGLLFRQVNDANNSYTNRMIIDTDGNVGIGTITPSRPLHVLFSGDSGVRIESTDNHSSLYIESHSGKGQYIRFSENTADKYWINSSGGKLYVRPAGTGTAANQEIFDSSGNVGIGTTSPSQKLHVVGNTTTTGVSYTDIVQTYSGSSIDFRHQDASVVMRVDTSNARVGIGTTSPSAKLHVVTNNSPAQLYLQRTGSITGNYRLGVAGATNKFYITDVAQSQDRLVIDGSGNVTVSGNINVGEKIAHDGDSNTYMQLTTDQINFYAGNVRMLTLQESTHDQIVINENGSDVNFRIETDTESNAFYMDGAGSGNVGIGTSTPSAKMHVEGTIKAKVYTVATLPSASPAGQRAFVSDSYYNLQESHGSGVYGGGSYFCPVYSDGSNWYNG